MGERWERHGGRPGQTGMGASGAEAPRFERYCARAIPKCQIRPWICWAFRIQLAEFFVLLDASDRIYRMEVIVGYSSGKDTPTQKKR